MRQGQSVRSFSRQTIFSCSSVCRAVRRLWQQDVFCDAVCFITTAAAIYHYCSYNLYHLVRHDVVVATGCLVARIGVCVFEFSRWKFNAVAVYLRAVHTFGAIMFAVKQSSENILCTAQNLFLNHTTVLHKSLQTFSLFASHTRHRLRRYVDRRAAKPKRLH